MENNHEVGKCMQLASHRQWDARFEGPKLTKTGRLKRMREEDALVKGFE